MIAEKEWLALYGFSFFDKGQSGTHYHHKIPNPLHYSERM